MQMSFLEAAMRGFWGAGIASLGFAILFNIRGRSVFYAGLTGGIGGLVYNLSVLAGISSSISNFYAAIALSVCGEILARRLKCTVSTFIACGLIPLVPGGDAYRMMVQFLEGKIYAGLQYGLETATISGMLCLGILSVAALTQFFFYSRKQIRKKTGALLDTVENSNKK